MKEGILSYEAGMTVLDTLEDFISTMENQLKGTSKKHSKLLDSVITMFVAMLHHCRCSKLLVDHLFASIRSFIKKFHRALFVDKNNLLADLILELLRYCNSFHYVIRDAACSLLYLLIKVHFQV